MKGEKSCYVRRIKVHDGREFMLCETNKGTFRERSRAVGRLCAYSERKVDERNRRERF